MKRDNFDKLAQAADLIKGVVDTMVCMEDARQDRLIPITVLCSFEAVLEKAFLRLREIEMTECGQEGGSIPGC